MLRNIIGCLAAVLLFSACSGGQVKVDGASIQPSTDRGSTSKSLTHGLTLPVEAYIFSESEISDLTRAMNLLAQRCMNRKGFDYVPDEASAAVIGGVMDRRYGIADIGVAEMYGYHPPAETIDAAATQRTTPPLSTDELAALIGETYEGGSESLAGGGCVGESKVRLADDGGFGPDDVGRDLNLRSFVETQKVPRVIAVFRDWSSCMKVAGYDYASPLDAINDPAFSSERVSAKEISTARADVRCKNETGLVLAWFEVESEWQRKRIESDAKNFARAKRQKILQLARAADVLG